MISENIRISREEAKKSVYDVERETGINNSQIYRWEQGKNEPSISQCIKLADCYGISLDELVGRKFEIVRNQVNAKYYKCKF